jgi:Myb/SANT-like DNA-binding domain
VFKKFGENYYLSQDVGEKAAILQQIEVELKASGYKFSWCEIERRLKNMKSHYRRKKSDLDRGLAASVEWEYYRELDRIFANQDKPSSSGDEVKVFAPDPSSSFKRKMEPESVAQPKQEMPGAKPQDL